MTYQFQNISILVVDSQPAIVDLMAGVLQMLGIQKIISRTDGQNALTAFERFMPDLLIIDWDLNNIDGIDFTKTIRKSSKNPYIPIIFMTAFSSEKRVVEARDSGITEFLKKPFTTDDLYKRIETIIEKPRPFIKAPEFFGPDRRRSRNPDSPENRKRREEDSNE